MYHSEQVQAMNRAFAHLGLLSRTISPSSPLRLPSLPSRTRILCSPFLSFAYGPRLPPTLGSFSSAAYSFLLLDLLLPTRTYYLRFWISPASVCAQRPRILGSPVKFGERFASARARPGFSHDQWRGGVMTLQGKRATGEGDQERRRVR